MFYNCLWLLASFLWFDNFIRKVRTPIHYHLLFYVLIYIFLTISFIYLLRYIKQSSILAIAASSIISVILVTLAFTLTELAIEMPDFMHFTKNYNEYGLFWIMKKNFWLSSSVTLSFIVGPASLLSCYFTNIIIQKTKNKNT